MRGYGRVGGDVVGRSEGRQGGDDSPSLPLKIRFEGRPKKVYQGKKRYQRKSLSVLSYAGYMNII